MEFSFIYAFTANGESIEMKFQKNLAMFHEDRGSSADRDGWFVVLKTSFVHIDM